MDQTPRPDGPRASCEVVDFDEALLDARAPKERDQLMAEAGLLARAFAPDGRAVQLEALARDLQSGLRDLEFGRAHACRLAAALRRLAREAG